MSSLPPCPEEQILRDLSAGRLGDAEAREIRTHVQDCRHCRALFDEMEAGEDSGTIRTLSFAETLACSVPDDSDSEIDIATEPEELATIDQFILTPSDQENSIGRIGEREILALLGKGAMGVVFKGFEESLHRMVAIKVLAPNLSYSERARRRFIKEAQAAAAINHPNVVTIHSVNAQHQTPHLVMEYISGVSLRQRIRSGPPLEKIEVLRISVQIADGLAAAHEQGVIHRDIKPANIMLEDGVERVKITDFGLALAALHRSGATSLERMVGTPAYMSPEQVSNSAEVDPRTDLFSFGCVIYAMFTGKSPFKGAHTLEVIRNVTDFHPQPLWQANPKVPRELSDVVDRLLKKNPADRYQSAREVASILKRMLSQAYAEQSTFTRTPQIRKYSDRRFSRSHTALAVSGTLLLLAALVAATWLKPRTPDNSRPLKRPTTPSKSTLLTVGPGPSARFHTIGEAIGHAKAGDVVQVLDDSEYPEPVRIADSNRLRNLVLEAPLGATLSCPETSDTVIEILDTPGVTIRGFTIRASTNQHGIAIGGRSQGLLIEGCRLEQAEDSLKAAVYLRAGASGTSDQPIVLRKLDLHCGTLGITFFGTPDKPASWIRLEDSRIFGSVVLLLLDTAVSEVQLSRNIFSGGVLNLNLTRPEQSSNLAIVQNTFYQSQNWLGLAYSDLDQGQIEIHRNLILNCLDIDSMGYDLNLVSPWFHENWWVRSPGMNEEHARLLSEIKDNVPVLSTDPESPDFLVPTSTLGSSENDAGFIGARQGSNADSTP